VSAVGGLPFWYDPGLAASDTWSPWPFPFWDEPDPIRTMERASIRAFMEQHKGKLKGRVLDFGAGEQPYRDLVEGEYLPFEGSEIQLMETAEGEIDAIICNQVLQYVDLPDFTIQTFAARLKEHGHLILTYATNWDEVSGDCYHGSHCDRWRFTKKGMEDLLDRAGFEVIDHQRRCEVRVGAFTFPIGYGVVARLRPLPPA
jgi:predicted TPR repeat methyltransferase